MVTVMPNNQPRFRLDIAVSFEELLTLNAALNSSAKGVQRQLEQLNDDADDRAEWRQRLEYIRSLKGKLDAYIEDPTFDYEIEGGNE
jgi:FtsZ-binding cell division protein ZapB